MSNFRRVIRDYITSEENSKLLGEGLIKTHNPEKVVYKLNNFANNNLKVEYIQPSGDVLGFINIYPKIKTNDFITHIIKYMNNMGYFFVKWAKEYEGFIKTTNIEDYSLVHVMRFEPKFDVEYLPKERYLYHVTDKKFIPKIMKIGLTPRTQSKIGYHPERIYLAKSKEWADDIASQFKFGGMIEEPNMVTLRIDLQNLFIYLQQDGQFEGGVYTTDNIPPNHIEIMD